MRKRGRSTSWPRWKAVQCSPRVYGHIEAFDQAAAGLFQPWHGVDHRETFETQGSTPQPHRSAFVGNKMTAESDLEQVAAAERHNRLAKQIVSEIVYAPICDGGSMSDVMMLCESVLVGVLLECFKLGDDVKMLDLIVGRVKERLAKARLEDLETKGSG
jgi:hypothetical protein